MITAQNYAAQAVRALTDLAARMLKKPDSTGDAAQLIAFCKDVVTAEHFVIPDGGEIFDDKLRALRGVNLRLPFPKITLEYFVDRAKVHLTELTPHHAPKRLLLAREMTREQIADEIYQGYGLKIPKAVEGMESPHYIVVNVANEVNGLWSPAYLALLIPSNWDDPNFKPGAKAVPALMPAHDDQPFAAIPVPWLFGPFDWVVAKHGEQYAYSHGTHDVAGEARALLEMLEALTCRNVKPAHFFGADAMTNRKRIAKGKLPLYPTYHLVVDAPEHGGHSGGQAAQPGRRSPREHLRRGHVRRLPSGNVWVNAAVINAGGGARG